MKGNPDVIKVLNEVLRKELTGRFVLLEMRQRLV